jgi:hypothetical protein
MVLKFAYEDFFKRIGYYDKQTDTFTPSEGLELSSDELKQLAERIGKVSKNISNNH